MFPSVKTDRQTKIAELAYYKAERRGFEPGHELEDWIQAEREVSIDESTQSYRSVKAINLEKIGSLD